MLTHREPTPFITSRISVHKCAVMKGRGSASSLTEMQHLQLYFGTRGHGEMPWPKDIFGGDFVKLLRAEVLQF